MGTPKGKKIQYEIDKIGKTIKLDSREFQPVYDGRWHQLLGCSGASHGGKDRGAWCRSHQYQNSPQQDNWWMTYQGRTKMSHRE